MRTQGTSGHSQDHESQRYASAMCDVCAVVVAKLAAQLEAPITNNRPLVPIVFSADAAGDMSKLVSVAWIPTSRGCTFVAAHSSGNVLVYPKVSWFQLMLHADAKRIQQTAVALSHIRQRPAHNACQPAVPGQMASNGDRLLLEEPRASRPEV